MKYHITKGQSYPLGATVAPTGTNFCIFSKNAYEIELLLFEDRHSSHPSAIIRLTPDLHRTFYYWHVFVEGIGHGQVYGYRVYGPNQPEKGMFFDGSKLLLDPYAKAVVMDGNYRRRHAMRPGDNTAHAMRSVVVDGNHYDWEGDKPLCRSFSKSIIYEMHVGGFTKNPNSGVEPHLRGTFKGLIEKIPYLKELGITAVELLPVYHFDPQDAPEGRLNYWGYSPVSFFAPHPSYGTPAEDPTLVVREFKDMVKALHRADIEVILDVVYNHTAEGPADGAALCYRGLETLAYYLVDPKSKQPFMNFSGTGNTLNANHSIVRRLIMDSLRYWVSEMHVDGFRFDLASILSRGEDGKPMKNPPILWEIESDPVLAGTKLIAEAWDAAGLYQVGNFIGDKWSEWNGAYRDAIRRFVKGDQGMVEHFVRRVEGSPDFYQGQKRDPNRSINFVTCHDGFTLNDLVSYNEKHNEANGEQNRDGSNDNFSWNCGVEGPTSDWGVEQLRRRQIKNLFTLLMCSQGTPMFMMGDEVRRTQGGNNNAYCLDDERNWFDWNDPQRHQDVLQFVQKLIDLNNRHHVFMSEEFWNTKSSNKRPCISWHGIHFEDPDLSHHSHSIAYLLTDVQHHEQFFVICNMYWKSLTFQVPRPNLLEHREFARIIDTSRKAGEDFIDLAHAPKAEGSISVPDRSIIVLQAR